MNQEARDYFINELNKVLRSKKSRLNKKDLEILIKVREGLKNSKSKNSVKKYLKILLELIGIGSNLIDKFK